MTDVVNAIKNIADRSNQKRIALWYIADRRLGWEKFLRVVAGIMALVSGASITSLFGANVEPAGVKVFAACVAFLSGAVGLVSSIYFDSTETAKVSESAGKFLALRERCRSVILDHSIAGSHGANELKSLYKDYADYSEASDRFLPVGFITKFQIPVPSMTWEG